MELLRPISFDRPTNEFLVSHSSDFQYTDPVLNVPITKRITVLTLGLNIELDMSPASVELVTKYAAMQSLIKSCVDNAEYINSSLLSLRLKGVNYNDDEKRKEILGMDFMALRQWFMDDVRASKIYKGFAKYNSTSKLKPFSQAFYKFIIDRNIYTHGELCYVKPDYRFALNYIHSEKKRHVYSYINSDIIISYNDCYKEIAKIVSEYMEITQSLMMAEYNKKNGIAD